MKSYLNIYFGNNHCETSFRICIYKRFHLSDNETETFIQCGGIGIFKATHNIHGTPFFSDKQCSLFQQTVFISHFLYLNIQSLFFIAIIKLYNHHIIIKPGQSSAGHRFLLMFSIAIDVEPSTSIESAATLKRSSVHLVRGRPKLPWIKRS